MPRIVVAYCARVSTSVRRTPSSSRNCCRSGDSTCANGIPALATAQASNSTSMRSVFLRCWPTSSWRTRVVSTNSTSCPQLVSTLCTCQASRQASIATSAGRVPGPSKGVSPCTELTVARCTTLPSATSQKAIFRAPKSKATLLMVDLAFAPGSIAPFERVGVSTGQPVGARSATTLAAAGAPRGRLALATLVRSRAASAMTSADPPTWPVALLESEAGMPSTGFAPASSHLARGDGRAGAGVGTGAGAGAGTLVRLVGGH